MMPSQVKRSSFQRANCHYQKPDFYCGRRWKGYLASPLANPYRVGDDRGNAVSRYGRWLWDQIKRRNPAVLSALRQILAHVQAHGSVSLGCWCHEHYQCHTDTIANALMCNEVIEILEDSHAA